jgi:hypothetical protein
MTATATCPTCGHPDTHTALAGCTYAEADRFCTCTTRWVRPKTLDDARAERDAALETVTAGTDPDWEAAAIEAVRVLAARHPDTFTTDDVWDLLAERGAPECREPRALGTIMREALRHGVVRAEGYAPSRRRRMAPVRLYIGASS